MSVILNETLENALVIPLRGLVAFPKTTLSFDVGRKKSINALKLAMEKKQLIYLLFWIYTPPLSRRDSSCREAPAVENMAILATFRSK